MGYTDLIQFQPKIIGNLITAHKNLKIRIPINEALSKITKNITGILCFCDSLRTSFAAYSNFIRCRSLCFFQDYFVSCHDILFISIFRNL